MQFSIRIFCKLSKILRRPGGSPRTPYETGHNLEPPKFFRAYATADGRIWHGIISRGACGWQRKSSKIWKKWGEIGSIVKIPEFKRIRFQPIWNSNRLFFLNILSKIFYPISKTISNLWKFRENCRFLFIWMQNFQNFSAVSRCPALGPYAQAHKPPLMTHTRPGKIIACSTSNVPVCQQKIILIKRLIINESWLKLEFHNERTNDYCLNLNRVEPIAYLYQQTWTAT